MVKDYTSVKKETFVNPGLIPCNVPALKGATWWFPAAIPNLRGSWWVDKSQAWTTHTQHTHRHICIHIYIYIYLAYYSTCRPNNAYIWLNAHICIQHIHIHIYIFVCVRVCLYIYLYFYIHTIKYYKSLIYFQYSPCFMASWWPQAWHSVPPASRVPGRRSDRSTATPRRNGENTTKIRRTCFNKYGHI
jgi:hypothetical protein